jgi:hypothetical protein
MRGEFIAMVSALLVSALLVWALAAPVALAQPGSAGGGAPWERLQQEKAGKNKFRGGVSSPTEAKQNMERLFKEIMIQGQTDGSKDRWYSPHLRDSRFDPENRTKEAFWRGNTVPQAAVIKGFQTARQYCKNPWNPPIIAACYDTEVRAVGAPEPSPATIEKAKKHGIPLPLTHVCNWHDPPGVESGHRPEDSCNTSVDTQVYEGFDQNTNFKACCVKEGFERATSEQIAAKHPNGDGWAGLFEYFYPVTAVGWENDRTTSMIVEKEKITQCIEKSEPLMENPQAQEWVAKAIARNLATVNGSAGVTGEPDPAVVAKVREQIAQDIAALRPQDRDLRFSDSLQSEGLTVRVNLATMDPAYRKRVAQRFCMHPDQFEKLMDPRLDNVQWQGGNDPVSLANLPIWSNYCPEGVTLMTNPDNTKELVNFDGTPTKLPMGYEVWKRDPLYCQSMNQFNESMLKSGISKVVRESSKGQYTEEMVGYTCREGDKLNGSLVPVEMYRHAAVERRTAIGDHVVAMLHAARLAPGMHAGPLSFLKGYEPIAYTSKLPDQYRPFKFQKFFGNGTNELVRVHPEYSKCDSFNGENYQGQNKSDKLYISNVTHEPFTQEPVDDQSEGPNRYVQEWAKDKAAGKTIAERGLDEKSQNYATAFRVFATCPKGYVRWRPDRDGHNNELRDNLDALCREEYFGGLPGGGG